MTLNSSIDVYFHMRNHYKKLKHVKSVIDCSAPKGRSRRDKSPKVGENSSGKHHDRAKSASRPKTRRNPRDMPRQTSKSAGRHNSHVECDVNNYEQHEYLQFSLRITEDIIKNDLYDNDQMKRVLASHFEANKGRLDADKMIAALYELCLELNIPITESLEQESVTVVQNIPTQTEKHIPSSQFQSKLFSLPNFQANVQPASKTDTAPPCICPDRKLSNTTDPCLCMIERKPPIPCLLHPSTCAMQLTGAESLEIKILKPPERSPDSRKMLIEISSQLADSSEKYPEIQILHPPRNKSESQSRMSTDTKVSDRLFCECDSETCIRDNCDGVNTQIEKVDILILDSSQGDSEKSEKSTSNSSSVEEEEKMTPLESNELIEKLPEFPEGDDNDEEEEEEEEEEEMEVQEEVVKREHTKDCKLDQLVQEYDKRMAHPKNIHQLDISHYRTAIEPVKVDTSDLNVQTSLEKIHNCKQEFENQRVKLSVSRGTQSILQCSENCTQKVVIVPPKQSQKLLPNYGQSSNDFIVLEGPIFIPKTSMNKGADVSFNPNPSRNQCVCGKISITQCECGKPGTNNQCDLGHTVHATYSNIKAPSHTSSFVQKSLYQDQANQNLDILHHERPPCERCEPCRTSSYYNKPAHYSRHYHECDITPQREISMYNNMNCKYVQNSSCCIRNENLLLGNHCSRYSMSSNNNISHFYPTIATQVSSMDILTNKPEKIEQKESNKKESINVNEEMNVTQRHTKSTLSGSTDVRSAELKVTTPDFDLDVLEKLREIPNTDSTDSMDKRIQSLRNDMNKFRDGENLINGLTRSPPEPIVHDRGVSISEEVEMIKDYSILKKTSINDHS